MTLSHSAAQWARAQPGHTAASACAASGRQPTPILTLFRARFHVQLSWWSWRPRRPWWCAWRPRWCHWRSCGGGGAAQWPHAVRALRADSAASILQRRGRPRRPRCRHPAALFRCPPDSVCCGPAWPRRACVCGGDAPQGLATRRTWICGREAGRRCCCQGGAGRAWRPRRTRWRCKGRSGRQGRPRRQEDRGGAEPGYGSRRPVGAVPRYGSPIRALSAGFFDCHLRGRALRAGFAPARCGSVRDATGTVAAPHGPLRCACTCRALLCDLYTMCAMCSTPRVRRGGLSSVGRVVSWKSSDSSLFPLHLCVVAPPGAKTE